MESTPQKESDPLLQATVVRDDDDLDDEEKTNIESNKEEEHHQGPRKSVLGDHDEPYLHRLGEVIKGTWSLGLITFGDSASQTAIIQDQICEQRKWMDKETFMELFALSRALPGPLATQLVMATSMSQAGPLGGFIALLLWVTPGAILLTCCGMVVEALMDPEKPPIFLMGIPPATVALVFKAAYNFSVGLDRFSFGLTTLSCVAAVLINGDYNIKDTDSQFAYPVMLACGGILTLLDATVNPNPIGQYTGGSSKEDIVLLNRIGLPIWSGLFIIQTWAIILLATVLLVTVGENDHPILDIFEAFFRIGSVVFGGGEDVLALIDAEMVPNWVTREQFLQGLGITQAMPGPLFNLAAFIGAIKEDIPGAVVAVVGVFAPAYFFMLAGIALWAVLHTRYWFKALLKGVNAVSIGFIGAACIFIWEQAVVKAADAMVFVVAGSLTGYYNLPPPIVILVSVLLGALLNAERISLGQVPYKPE